MNDLLGVLLRFRQDEVSTVGDMEAMFIKAGPSYPL